jgi:hypothetical protein
MRTLLSLLTVAALSMGYQIPVQQSSEVDFDRTWRPTRMSVSGPTISGELVVQTAVGELTFRDDARLHELVRGTRYRLVFEQPLLGGSAARLGSVEALSTLVAAR